MDSQNTHGSICPAVKVGEPVEPLTSQLLFADGHIAKTDYNAAQIRQKIEDALAVSLPQDDATAAPCRALLFSGGKRWRPLLFVLCAMDERGTPRLPMDDIYRLAAMVEFVHTASLIHDDIEDGAVTRRGKPCAHITYGVDAAINAASYLYFLAERVIDDAPLDDGTRCRLYSIYVDTLLKLHRGQALDISWHKDGAFFPTVEQYCCMAAMKTGALAGMAARAGALAGGASDETEARLEAAAVKLGVGFQALDDALDIEKGNPGKERGDDIVEGKKSLPVLLHLMHHPGDKDKITALFQRARAEGIKGAAVAEGVSLLCQSGTAAEAHERGHRLITEAKEEFGTSMLGAFVDELLGV